VSVVPARLSAILLRMQARTPGSLLPVILAALAAACGDGGAGGEQPVLQHGAVPPSEDLSVLDELAALGYVDFAELDAAKGSGVVLNERAAAGSGYTLVTSLPHSRAMLIDMDGAEVRAWEDPELVDTRWSRVRLLANGDVMCIASKADMLTRLTFAGELVWRLSLEVHHDGVELPDGRLLVLTRSFRTIPEIDTARRCVDNHLAFVSADGKLLEEHSLYDILTAEPQLLRVERPAGLEDLPVGYNIDPMHANTVQWLSSPEVAEANPLFQPGRVLVTIRYLDAIALLDLAEGRCVWTWGRGMLEGPHDAQVLADGRVLVLDNGYDARGWSRVVLLDPLSGEIVWQYRAAEPREFHTSGRGTVQALANGNVLVGNSNSGEAFEVDRDGRLVWRYLNPLRDEKGARGVIRVERYPAAVVEPWLGR
jgi:hypothetical protein